MISVPFPTPRAEALTSLSETCRCFGNRGIVLAGDLAELVPALLAGRDAGVWLAAAPIPKGAYVPFTGTHYFRPTMNPGLIKPQFENAFPQPGPLQTEYVAAYKCLTSVFKPIYDSLPSLWEVYHGVGLNTRRQPRNTNNFDILSQAGWHIDRLETDSITLLANLAGTGADITQSPLTENTTSFRTLINQHYVSLPSGFAYAFWGNRLLHRSGVGERRILVTDLQQKSVSHSSEQ